MLSLTLHEKPWDLPEPHSDHTDTAVGGFPVYRGPQVIVQSLDIGLLSQQKNGKFAHVNLLREQNLVKYVVIMPFWIKNKNKQKPQV